LKRADERKAREEVRKTLDETGPVKKSEAKFPVEAKMSPENGVATTMTKPAPAPGSKEDRLSELLDLYKADKDFSAEYHDQRAKIIADLEEKTGAVFRAHSARATVNLYVRCVEVT